MKNNFLKKMIGWTRARISVVLIAFMSLLIGLCVAAHEKPASTSDDQNMLAVGVIGVQHIGETFSISEFYVNGQWGGNVGKGGGGGGNVCCVMLPLKWHPGLVAEIRWSIADWSNEKKIETKTGNYRSIVWRNYKAQVPIEKYESAEDLYIHFFAGGRVRAVSSIFGSVGTGHPIQRGDAQATAKATMGHLQDSLFTKSELEQIKKKNSKEADKEGN